MNGTGPRPSTQSPRFAGGKHLAFRLGAEDYGVAIQKVREIIGAQPVTPLPRTPDHVLGWVNLRGRIVPVVDLRRLLVMAPQEPTAETCIVVVDVGSDPDGDAPPRIGCVVDSVREVVSVLPEQCEPAPRCARPTGEFVAGLAQDGDRVLILLDIDRVLADVDPAASGRGAP